MGKEFDKYQLLRWAYSGITQEIVEAYNALGALDGSGSRCHCDIKAFAHGTIMSLRENRDAIYDLMTEAREATNAQSKTLDAAQKT